MEFDLGHGVVATGYAHTLAERACTSYVTAGLRQFGQAEIVFTVTDMPEPLHVLGSVAEFASQGRLVSEGGFTEVSPTDGSQLRGFTYQRAWPINGVPTPAGTLAMVALIGAEMDAAKEFGALRVLARLGNAFRYFPTAVWCDVGRGEMSGVEQDSILNGLPMVFGGGSTVIDNGSEIVLSIPRAEQPILASVLTHPDMPFGLTMSLHQTADSCLVWQPGQDADGLRLIEDGFAFVLTDESWRRLRLALTTCSPATVPFDHRPLKLTWTYP